MTNLDAIELAIENGAVILCLPPHCSHKMQPLDVAFMNPLSKYYAEEVANWQRDGHTVAMKDVYRLFGKAFKRAAKKETAENGFAKTGICPLNSKIFKDSEFVNLTRESTSDTNKSR